MSLPTTPPIHQPNVKRYWGEEKNVDSIYSIYLKKICYTYNNILDTSTSLTSDSFRKFQDTNQKVGKQQQVSGGSGGRSGSSSSKKSPKHHKSMHELSTNHQAALISQLSKPTPPLVQPQQALQWETRQIKVLQAATLDHALKFILLVNSSSLSNSIKSQDKPKKEDDDDDDGKLEDERNNVAHITHVMFCTYRIYTNPYELMLKLMGYSDICRLDQFRFVMHYWMDNYQEDFEYLVELPENQGDLRNSKSIAATTATAGGGSPLIIANTNGSTSITSHNNSITSYDSSMTNRTTTTTDSETSNHTNGNGKMSIQTIGSGGSSGVEESENLNRRLSNLSIKTADGESVDRSGVPLVNELLRLCKDEYIRKRAMKLMMNSQQQQQQLPQPSSSSFTDFNNDAGSGGSKSNGRRRRHQSSSSSSSKSNSAVLDLDSRYVAQQLTAIDLENFLNLKPYSLLEGTKSDKCIQSMIKNFNLLSKHVIVTILKSHQPHIVTSHWITIAMNLRKIKNFNSLKAIIAGLTNESIHRLKQIIWNKIDRNSFANFKSMASIVDDVNNQTVLRQTQLIVEGTAKMSIEDDSFGTIPYLGTFLTDLNMIDARYPTYVPSPKDETCKLKLINFEKCAKQYEILTQVQLLQKNVLASLHAMQRRNHFDEQSTLNRLKLEFNQNHQMLLAAKPAIPQVSRLFENWFYDNNVATMTDKKCYEISTTLEQNVITR